MKKVGFVFDTTAAINKELSAKYDFEYVSLYLTINDKSYLVSDLDEKEFLANFSSYKTLKSASPSPQSFVDAYNKQFAKGFKDIIVLPLSSKISSTRDVAIIAISMLDEHLQKHVHIIDTLMVCLNFDSFVFSMQDVLDKDLDVEEMIKEVERHNQNSVIVFEVNDLKHLHRGGRLGTIAYYFAELLKIKPLIEFSDGVLKQIGKNRNRNKNIDIILSKIKKFESTCKNIFVNFFSYGHAQEESALEKIISVIKTTMPKIILNRTHRIDPVFNTHVGSNGYAIAITAFN